jgi:hypothetical protein
MEDQIIDNLKEWFEKEWLFERHLTSEFMKDKEAFSKGCTYFDNKNYAFTGDLLIQLRKESGLAEVARMNKDLEKYATHCYRQVEKVISEFMKVNPGREKLGAYFLNGYDMIQNPSTIQELNPSILKLLYHTKPDGSLNENCLILKLNYIHKAGAYCYQGPNPDAPVARVKNITDNSWHFSQKEQENLFKARLWYKTFGRGWSDVANAVEDKPAFEAFKHMSFFRNVGSHLNSDYKPFKMPNNTDPTSIHRLKGFYENPLRVMDSNIESPGFYQRYVDMVLLLYSEYLRNPEV